MNMPKIMRAAQASDVVADNFVKAQQALRDCWVNGYGVLTDRGQVRAQLYEAKAAIEAAQLALRDVDWPTNDDYDE